MALAFDWFECWADRLEEFLHRADIQIAVVKVCIERRHLGLKEHPVEVDTTAAQR
ncbi:hypothetical protein D3C76_1462840 [compost metagenome]